MWKHDTVQAGASEPQTSSGMLTPRRFGNADVQVDISVFKLISHRSSRWRSSSASLLPGPGVYYLSSSDAVRETSKKQGHMRISEAKAILAEAVNSYTPSTAAPAVHISRSHHTLIPNHGAVAPLVLMLSTCSDMAKLEAALSTFTLLLMDPSNCRSALQLESVPAVLEAAKHLAGGHPRPMVAVLAALTTLCRHSSDAKLTLWSHPSSTLLLKLLMPHQRSDTIIASLHVFGALAFTTADDASRSSDGAACAASPSGRPSSHSSPLHDRPLPASAFAISPPLLASNHSSSTCLSAFSSSSALDHLGRCRLLSPELLSSCAVLLHARSSDALLLATFELLTAAADVPMAEHLSAWHQVLYSSVPLLQSASPEVVQAALGMLLVLSEHAVFQRVMYAAGCVSPVLSFLAPSSCGPCSDVASRNSSSTPADVTSRRSSTAAFAPADMANRSSSLAAAILCGLSGGGLTRDRLCHADCMAALVAALANCACEEVTIGILQTLANLASHRPAPVLVYLRQKPGLTAMLEDIVASTDDEDVVAAAAHLSMLLTELAGHVVSMPVSTPSSPFQERRSPFESRHSAGLLQRSGVSPSVATPPFMFLEDIDDGCGRMGSSVATTPTCSTGAAVEQYLRSTSVASSGDLSSLTGPGDATRSSSVMSLDIMLAAAQSAGGGSSPVSPSSILALAKGSPSSTHTSSRFHRQYRRRPSQQLAEQYRRQQALKQMQQASQNFSCVSSSTACC